jgi:two-component SAPR family response regulator
MEAQELISTQVPKLIRQIECQPVTILERHPELLIQRAVLEMMLDQMPCLRSYRSNTRSIALRNQFDSARDKSLNHLRALLGFICYALGYALLECGAFASAAALFTQALELYERANDQMHAALVEYDLGTLYVQSKKCEEALTHLQRARQRFQRAHAVIEPSVIALNTTSAAIPFIPDRPHPLAAPVSNAARLAVWRDSETPPLQIFTLGQSLITRARETRPLSWQSTSAKELILFMILNPQPWSKEQIIDALWPDWDWTSATKVFHSNLYRVRQVAGASCIRYQDDLYQINPDLPVWIDSVEFEKLIQTANGNEEPDRMIELLSRALELYRGDFLGGLYSDWISIPRAALREKYVMTLSRSAQYHARMGQIQRAVELFEAVLAQDNLREDVYGALMKLHGESGEVNAACQVYRRCVEVLRQELGAAPRAEIQALYAEIRTI